MKLLVTLLVYYAFFYLEIFFIYFVTKNFRNLYVGTHAITVSFKRYFIYRVKVLTIF